MINEGKKNILGIQVDAVDYEAAVDSISKAAQQERPYIVSAMAVHGLMTGVLDRSQGYRLNHFDLVVPDGQPVAWALNGLHQARLPGRVYGPQLTLELCREAARLELPVYFYGSKPDVLERLTSNLKRQFPSLQIAGTSPSLFRTTSAQERVEIAERISSSGARLVFVGLGCPRQEIWAYEYRKFLNMPLVAVGAAFDFHAGSLAQAPAWMQSRGLEWLFRLVLEPRRLWKRYLGLNPLFLTALAAQWLFGPQIFSAGQLPHKEELYG